MSSSIALLPTCALAESQYEREMAQLRVQRDKALSESGTALNARYRAALEQVYRRALQANDPTAEAIKTELETLGPLRVGVATTTASPSAMIHPKTMQGTWDVKRMGREKESWEIKEDGTCAVTFGANKVPNEIWTWAKAKDKIEFRSPKGVYTFEWPVKNNRVEGYGPAGNGVTLTKAR